MIKVFLFDADGVVTVSPEKFSDRFSREFNVDYEEKILPFFENDFAPCLIGQADLKEIIKPYLGKWGWQKSVEELLKYWFGSENHVDERVVGAIKKLRAIGVKCYLVTNQEKYRTQYLREQMGFSELFDRVFCSAEIGFKKSDPRFFKHVMVEIGNVEKDAVLLLDDKEKNVESAKEFGFQARVYHDFSDLEEEMSKLGINIKNGS